MVDRCQVWISSKFFIFVFLRVKKIFFKDALRKNLHSTRLIDWRRQLWKSDLQQKDKESDKIAFLTEVSSIKWRRRIADYFCLGSGPHLNRCRQVEKSFLFHWFIELLIRPLSEIQQNIVDFIIQSLLISELSLPFVFDDWHGRLSNSFQYSWSWWWRFPIWRCRSISHVN